MPCNDPLIVCQFHFRHERTQLPSRGYLKPTLLLAAALFLITAPEPDARDISEMSAGFFVQDAPASLLADETTKP